MYDRINHPTHHAAAGARLPGTSLAGSPSSWAEPSNDHPLRGLPRVRLHIGRTAAACMMYPFSGPIVRTGALAHIEHRTNGTRILICNDRPAPGLAHTRQHH